MICKMFSARRAGCPGRAQGTPTTAQHVNRKPEARQHSPPRCSGCRDAPSGKVGSGLRGRGHMRPVPARCKRSYGKLFFRISFHLYQHAQHAHRRARSRPQAPTSARAGLYQERHGSAYRAFYSATGHAGRYCKRGRRCYAVP